MVGINRFRDIRGIFVNLPRAVPGLRRAGRQVLREVLGVQLRPAAGVLVGVGPFELMAEVALRFMGGLSDVDWLVEEGLRDINSESSRWSVPFLFGARFRF